MIFWLEDIMRPRITDDTYTTYKSAIKNYIVPQIGKMYMSTINQGYIRKLYNAVAEKYESVAVVSFAAALIMIALDKKLSALVD